MSTLHYVIGNSIQDVRVPLLVFTSSEKVNKFIAEHHLVSSEGLLDYLDQVLVDGEPVDLDEVLDSVDEGAKLRNALFLNGEYSSMEGAVYSLSVVEQEPGLPVVGFSLD